MILVQCPRCKMQCEFHLVDLDGVCRRPKKDREAQEAWDEMHKERTDETA